MVQLDLSLHKSLGIRGLPVQTEQNIAFFESSNFHGTTIAPHAMDSRGDHNRIRSADVVYR